MISSLFLNFTKTGKSRFPFIEKDIWKRDPKKDKCLIRPQMLRKQHLKLSNIPKVFFDKSSFWQKYWEDDRIGFDRNSLGYHPLKDSERSRFPRLTGTLKAKVIFYFEEDYKDKLKAYFNKRNIAKKETTQQDYLLLFELLKEYLTNPFYSINTFKREIPESFDGDLIWSRNVWGPLLYFQKFYDDHSFGRLKIEIDQNALLTTIDSWKRADGEQVRKYDLTKKIMNNLSADELDDLEDNYDFAILINVQSDDSYYLPTGFSFIKKEGEEDPQEVLGTSITNFNLFSYNFVSSTDGDLKYTIPHEAGHMLGLPDLYFKKSYKDQPTWRLTGSFDIMHMQKPPEAGFNAYTRWVYGWIPDSQVECIEYEDLPYWNPRLKSENGLKINLSHLNTDSNTRLIVVKGKSNRSVIVIERRGKSLGDKWDKFQKEGVLIYSIDSVSNTSLYVNNSSMLNRFRTAETRVRRVTPPLMLARSDWSTIEQKKYLYYTENQIDRLLGTSSHYQRFILNECIDRLEEIDILNPFRENQRTTSLRDKLIKKN